MVKSRASIRGSETFKLQAPSLGVQKIEDLMELALGRAMMADQGSEEELVATIKVVELAAQIRQENPFAALDALVAVSDCVDEGSDLEQLIAQGAERTLRVIEEKNGFQEALDVVTDELTQREESHPLNKRFLEKWKCLLSVNWFFQGKKGRAHAKKVLKTSLKSETPALAREALSIACQIRSGADLQL